MKLVKLFPSCHGGSGIFSIDVQPNDRRFATGGQADNRSGLVIIWSFKSFADAANGDSSNCSPRLELLCRLENHVGCVNCVRWSESGRYLASAGDDALVMIFQYAGRLVGNESSNLYGKNSRNVELWKCAHTFRGHSGDVLHVAWSSGDRYLASCSIDNQIIVWSGTTFEKIAVLSEHQGLVKGLAWDPVGKYLSSQSDDKTVRIWATSNWTLIKTIRKPFAECGPTTQFLRLDWSPDGSVLVTAHAMNSGGPVAKLVERSGWYTERDYVGHRKAITSAAVHSCICAVGSKDKSISIWSTKFLRPVAVLRQAFTQTVMDLAWNRKGEILLGCSSDGSILSLIFDKNELGRILPEPEKAEILKNLYGKNVLSSITNAANGHDPALSAGSTGGAFIIDNPEVLKLQIEKQKKQMDSSGTVKLNGNIHTKEIQPVVPKVAEKQEQTEVLTRDGRRRIKPIFLGAVAVADPAEESSPPSCTEVRQQQQPTNSLHVPVEVEPVPAPVDVSVAPVSVIDEQPTTSAEKDQDPIENSNNEKEKDSKSVVNDKTVSITNKSASIKRKQGEPPTSRPTKKSRNNQLNEKRQKRVILSEDEMSSDDNEADPVVEQPSAEVTPAVAKPLSIPQTRTVTLSTAKMKDAISITLEDAKNRSGSLILTCQNKQRVGDAVAASKLTCVENNSPVWQTLINSEVLAMAASWYIVAAAGCNRRLNIFNTRIGSRVLPPIVLDTDVALLNATKYHVLVVTSAGSVHVWNFENGFRSTCKESLSSLIQDSTTTLQNGFITEYGAPVLSFSNGQSFMYSSPMQCWLSIHDSTDALTSSCYSRVKTAAKNWKIEGPLSSCIESNNRLAKPFDSLISRLGDNACSSLAERAFLEMQMNTSLILKSPTEYRFWFVQYAQHLAREGSGTSLRHICDDLLGSVFERVIDNGNDRILGISKRDLLKDVLPTIASNPRLQRLYGEIREQLDLSFEKSCF